MTPTGSWALVLIMLITIGWFCWTMKQRQEHTDALAAFEQAEQPAEEPETTMCLFEALTRDIDIDTERILAQHEQSQRAVSDRPYDYEKDGL